MDAITTHEPILVDPDYKLLLTGYEYMGVVLDLYGDRDEEFDVEVCDVTLTGDKRSLCGLIPLRVVVFQMSAAVERADEIALAESKTQGKIDRAAHDQSMS